MREKKLQVFVSSTFTDLKQERQAAVEAILSSGNIPAGMELFSAGDESQMTIIERWIDESDVYMLILGGRYGSIEPKSGKSYTHLEYEYALKQKKPFFVVVLTDDAIDRKVKENDISFIERDNTAKFKKFKKLVTSKMIKPCDDAKDIKLAIHETLSDFSHNKNLIGWIRGDNTVNSNLLAEEIARLTKENDELRKISKTELLYNGFTYKELKEILLNIRIEKVKDDDVVEIKNLFQILKDSGEIYTEYRQIYKDLSTSALIKLNIVKIIKENNTDKRGFLRNNEFYIFTEDGHKFYLRALIDKI